MKLRKIDWIEVAFAIILLFGLILIGTSDLGGHDYDCAPSRVECIRAAQAGVR